MNAPYRVLAYNKATESENKIHDDAVARRYGFNGGLVPGVDVYAYMIHPAVARWGRDWLTGGSADVRLLKPIYDGDQVEVTAAEQDGGLALRVQSGGALCASGTATLADTSAVAAELPDATPPEPGARPPADETSLAIGTALAMRPLDVTPETAAYYLRAVREADPLYAREGLVHPGMILSMGNQVLKDNVVLGPWIHVGSTVRNLGEGRVGERIGARARVTANYERKGHRFVELDVAVFADGHRPLARIAHVAIYRPRPIG